MLPAFCLSRASIRNDIQGLEGERITILNHKVNLTPTTKAIHINILEKILTGILTTRAQTNRKKLIWLMIHIL